MTYRDRLHALDEVLIDTALDPGAWPGTLERIARAVGGIGADLHLLRGDTLLTNYIGGQPPELLAEYTDRFLNREPRSLALRRLQAQQVVTDLDFVDADTLRRHEYYADFLRRAGMGYCIAALPLRNREHLAYFGIHLPPGKPPPSRSLMAAVREFQPRLARAVAAQIKLSEAALRSDLYSGALDRMTSGVVVLNRCRQIVLMNALAKTALDDRAAFKVENARIESSNSKDSAKLDALIRSAVARTDDYGGAMLIGRDEPHYSVLVMPTPLAYAELTGAAALLLINDLRTAPPAASTHYLRQLYGLTRSEARTAIGLLKGRSLREIAADRRITYESTRTAVKQIFAKVGVHTQPELVAVLAQALRGA